MTHKRYFYVFAFILYLSFKQSHCENNNDTATEETNVDTRNQTAYSYEDLSVVDGKVNLTKEEWKKRLTPEQYKITREAGTESAGTGKYEHMKKNGTYICVCCGNKLFSSAAKFDSGSGWPSFFQAISNDSVKIVPDHSHGMEREEVQCNRCAAHLGHVFNDGPKPTGKRFCMNSASLNLVENA